MKSQISKPKTQILNFKSPNLGAFTLVELLVILGILAILSLGSLVFFRAYQPTLELLGTVRELIGDLRYSEQLALTEQVEYGIQFFPTEDKYQIVKFIQPSEVLETITLPEEVSFHQIVGFTDNRVVFNPYGAAKETGQITLINTQNSTTTIEVKASGFVKIITE